MVLWRLLFIWMMAAAIPIQGMAASAMLFCGPGTQHHGRGATHAVAGAQATTQEAAHAAHGHAQGHEEHQGIGLQEGAEASGTGAQAAQNLPDSMHKCSACDTCCQTIGIAEWQPSVAFDAASPSRGAEPFFALYPPPAFRLDKPPRA